MKKSKKVVLTLLGSIALATLGCSSDQKDAHPPNPYDDYSYAGKSGDDGEMYMHYERGLLNYYIISRMFDGYGYRWNMPYYRSRRRDDDEHYSHHGGGYGGYYSHHVYSGSVSSSEGLIGAHAAISRGGFGAMGLTHGLGG